MYRAVLASAALMLSAGALSAQITTYVAPPRPIPPSPLAVATADSVHRDSVKTANIKNMKSRACSVDAHAVGIWAAVDGWKGRGAALARVCGRMPTAGG